jgi:hypothetical protein
MIPLRIRGAKYFVTNSLHQSEVASTAFAPRIPTPSVLVSLANLAFCLHCYHARGTKAEKGGALSGIQQQAGSGSRKHRGSAGPRRRMGKHNGLGGLALVRTRLPPRALT